jgi:hypothetical protein
MLIPLPALETGHKVPRLQARWPGHLENGSAGWRRLGDWAGGRVPYRSSRSRASPRVLIIDDDRDLLNVSSVGLSGFTGVPDWAAGSPSQSVLFSGTAQRGRPRYGRIPRAGDSDSHDPPRAEQCLERMGDLGRATAAGRGIPQSGKFAGVNDVQVDVHVQRPVRQCRISQARDPSPADRCARRVGHFGLVEVPGAREQDPLLGHRPQAEAGGNQLGSVSHNQPQRQAAQVARCSRLEGLNVTVRVEPDDPDIIPARCSPATVPSDVVQSPDTTTKRPVRPAALATASATAEYRTASRSQAPPRGSSAVISSSGRNGRSSSGKYSHVIGDPHYHYSLQISPAQRAPQ